MEKLSKTARVLDRIVRVLRGLCIGFGIACAVLLVIAAVLPERLYSGFVSFADMTVNLGNVKLLLSRPLETAGSIRLNACIPLANGLVSLGLAACGLHLLHNILAPMAEARPFHNTVSNSLKKLGWLSLAGILISAVTRIVAAIPVVRVYNVDQLFAKDLVTGYTVMNTIDVTYLLIPVLLFLLSYVFRYGEELQKQSDETL